MIFIKLLLVVLVLVAVAVMGLAIKLFLKKNSQSISGRCCRGANGCGCKQ